MEKWPINLERKCGPGLQGKIHLRKREGKQDDIPCILPSALTQHVIQKGIKVTEKKNGKRGVILALKIVSLPSFLSPGNSLH